MTMTGDGPDYDYRNETYERAAAGLRMNRQGGASATWAGPSMTREQAKADAEKVISGHRPLSSDECGAGEPTEVYRPQECCAGACAPCEPPEIQLPIDLPMDGDEQVATDYDQIRHLLAGSFFPETNAVKVSQETVLEEASRIINGQRALDYGAPSVNFQRIADFWDVYLVNRPVRDAPISPSDVAQMLTLLKIARWQGGGGQRDSIVDACGYQGCLELLARGEQP